ncbi:MAG: alpha-L-fucosidase [bacterium]|nr:alpha-L-fucosidase [bacterium]
MMRLLTGAVAGALCHAGVGAESLKGGAPTPEQIAWHEMEIEMFLCLDPCTWQGREYDDHSTPLSDINPAQLDTDQWCEVAQSFGAKQILFVAKHTGGFCWWQTDTSDYSIKNTPYKDGKGDVLGELAESCRKFGLKLGVYIYPGDDQWGAKIGSGGRTEDPAKQDAYAKVLRQQWTEVLTRYGDVAEIWFDGSCVIELGDIIEKHAPKAMVFQGPHATLRWPGTESGMVPYPTWQTVSRADADTGVSTGKHSDPGGDVWLPMEMDTTLLDHKWFWAPDTDRMMKPLDKLMTIYYQSAGRGCVLLLNSTPDTSGRIPESHVRHYQKFGAAIQRIYENQKGEASGTGRTLELQFAQPTSVNHVVVMEDIRNGHTVRAYEVDGLVQGTWKKLIDGLSVGYKKIDVIDTVNLEAVRLRVTDAVDEPIIASLAAYEALEMGEVAADGAGPKDWHEIGGWSHAELIGEWQTVDVDLTPFIKTPGLYEVELRQADGGPTVEVQRVVVVVAGTEADRLITKLDRGMAWLIRRTDQVTPDERGRTVLRIVARFTGDGEREDRLYVRETQ